MRRITMNYTFNENLDPDQRIWKYMNLAKFMSLLETKSLYFCKADKFEDVFEGKIPIKFFHGWLKEHQDIYRTIHEKLKDRTFINCWSLNDEESYAMWKIYASRNNGLCIQTTIDKLNKSFNDIEKKPQIARVKYIDFKNDKILLDKLNTYEFYSYKSKVYEYENEVRAILILDKDMECKDLPVDLDMLIDNVYVHPAASEWFINLINSIFKTYRLEKEVKHSSIKIQV
jgi:hypothetical protein